ncbi:hypothetical protein FACS1894103_7190 [Campylobacterota bacterium]|nr:hypothetical protein FACS1894103_7190 [Campylobacterota bacterium]
MSRPECNNKQGATQIVRCAVETPEQREVWLEQLRKACAANDCQQNAEYLDVRGLREAHLMCELNKFL